MADMTMKRDMFMPRAPRGMGRGLMLAIAAHVLLVIALSFSVSWHSQTPEGVEAELWAAVPQIAAPRAVDARPPPAPAPVVAPTPKPVPRVHEPEPTATPPAPRPDAQIATERAEKKEAKRLAAEQALDAAKIAAAKDADKQKTLKAKQLKAAQDTAQEQKEEAAASAQLAAQREANLKRIMGQAGATGAATATGNAAQQAGPSADYLGRIKARIKPNVSFPDTVAGNPAVEIEVRLTAEGRIIQPSRVVKSSGAPEWDEAVLRAIAKTEVLPRDESGKVPPSMTIVYRPRD
jgi:colicin import membrane protein